MTSEVIKLLNQKQIDHAWKLLSLFKVDGKPANMCATQGNFEIFCTVIYKLWPRVACLAPTGYGKSEFVAMGVVYNTSVLGDPFVIASVKYGTSDIIMGKVIDHLFDHPAFYSRLELSKDTSMEKLKRDRRKEHINFKSGGDLKIVSLHGSDSDPSSAIGEHMPNIVLDESPLLSPTKYLAVKKILEGTGSYNQTFLFELGNAVNRNHFYRNIKLNKKYLHIDISLEQAISEGRLDEQSVEENRELPMFKEFYACQFPGEDEIDERGYRRLLTTDQIKEAMTKDKYKPKKPEEMSETDIFKLGCDIAGGGDYNTYICRTNDLMWIDGANKSNDTMTNVVEVENRLEKYPIKDRDTFLDDIGIGRGCTDRLKEKKHRVNGVSVGGKPMDEKRFSNIKAENYWAFKVWIEAGGKLVEDDRWYQLAEIRYKVNSDKVISIEPKDDLKKRVGWSPDFAEGGMLTFTKVKPLPTIRVLG